MQYTDKRVYWFSLTEVAEYYWETCQDQHYLTDLCEDVKSSLQHSHTLHTTEWSSNLTFDSSSTF